MNTGLNQQSSWQACLKQARAHAQSMNFEQSALCCIHYLHSHLAGHVDLQRSSMESSDQPQAAGRGLRIIFPCGGNGARWDNFMGIPKQLADCGEGVPLIQRTSDQFKRWFPSARRSLLSSSQGACHFTQIADLEIIHRLLHADTSVGIEVLENITRTTSADCDVLWAYGDVFFTEAAVATIERAIEQDRNQIKFFGRKQQNRRYGNTGGEVFAIYVPRHEQHALLQWYHFVRKLYVGTPMHRCSSWEVVALMTALRRGCSAPTPMPWLLDGDAWRTYLALLNVLQNKDFDPQLWVEIDDETEDFDFPCEYLDRLFQRVSWLGQGQEPVLSL